MRTPPLHASPARCHDECKTPRRCASDCCPASTGNGTGVEILHGWCIDRER